MAGTRSHLALASACLLVAACQAPATAPPPGGPPDAGATPASGGAMASGGATGPGGLIGRMGGKLRGADADGDGISDLIERALGSDPAVPEPDADHDRIPDRIEALLGTKADKADSDGDGFTDLFERFESQHAVTDRLLGRLKDRIKGRLAGQFGVLATATSTDYDEDGTPAATDADDDGNGIPDADEDADLDGVANGIERTGYYAVTGSGAFKAWSGDQTQTYYKTDPMQWSTDADPYGDGMEASGLNMDSAVPFPGNHPLIPALPDVQVELTNYVVSPYATISNSSNAKQSNAWSQEVVDETVTTSNVKTSVNAKASYDSGAVSASVDAHVSTDDTTVHTNRVTTDSSTLNESGWSSATTTDTAKAGKLTVTLKYQNVGTSPAYSVTPTINLTTGGQTFTFTADKVSSLGSGLAQSSTTYSYPQTGSTTTMTLTLDELARIQSGTPLVTEVSDMSASVFTSIGGTLTDADQIAMRSAYLGSNDWSTYKQGVMQKSFELFNDTGDGNASKVRVYAPPAYSPGTASDPPDVTVVDALAWAHQATDAADGTLDLKIWDPTTGKYSKANTKNWMYFFDEDTADGITSSTDVLDLMVYAGSRVALKAQPDTDHQPALNETDFDHTAKSFEANVFDYYTPKTVTVKSASGGSTLLTLSEVANTAGSVWKSTAASALDIRPTGTEVLEITNDVGTVTSLALPAVTTGATTTTARGTIPNFPGTSNPFGNAQTNLTLGSGFMTVIWNEWQTSWTARVAPSNNTSWYVVSSGSAATQTAFNDLTYAGAAAYASKLAGGGTGKDVLANGNDASGVLLLWRQDRYLGKVLITRKSVQQAIWNMGI